jgi:phage regulator Rha-like protein
MAGNRTHAEQMTFRCQECGTKYPLWKRMTGRNRSRSHEGHIKDLYCYRCEKVTKHEQAAKFEPAIKEVNMNLNLIQRNGAWCADSREIAEMTDKRHDHLIRDIEGYIEILSETPNLGNGVTVRVSDFFVESSYSSGNPPRHYKCFLITRRGCDMVANKMTGEKGILFTAAYVTKFEEMERQLRPIQPQSRDQIIQAGYVALLELVEEMKPKADYYDRLIDRNGLTNFRDTAKAIGIKESEFIDALDRKGFIYRDAGGRIKPSASYSELFELKEFISQRNGHTGFQTMITPKGRERFKTLFEGALV